MGCGMWLVRMLNEALGNAPRKKRAKILCETRENGHVVLVTACILDESLTVATLRDILDKLWKILLILRR